MSGQRRGAEEGAEAAAPGGAPVEGGEMGFGAEFPDRRHVLEVGRVVDQAAEMDPVAPRQMVEDLERPDLLPLVRRVGNPLTEKQQIGHRLTIRGRGAQDGLDGLE